MIDSWSIYAVVWLVCVGVTAFGFFWLFIALAPDPRKRRPEGPPPPHVNPEPGHVRRIRL